MLKDLIKAVFLFLVNYVQILDKTETHFHLKIPNSDKKIKVEISRFFLLYTWIFADYANKPVDSQVNENPGKA
eukprot:Pgem_evm1s15185